MKLVLRELQKPKVLSVKGKRQVVKLKSGERQKHNVNVFYECNCTFHSSTRYISS